MRTADLAEPPRPSWCHHPQMTEVPTAAGTFTPTQSKRALLCHRENGDLFPSRGDKTLPIPLQRVVKQRVPGCCCREPAATALGQHRPASSSTAARAPVEGEPAPHQPPGGVGAAVTAAWHGSHGACPDQTQGCPQGHPSQRACPRNPLVSSWTRLPWAPPTQQQAFLQAPHFCLPCFTHGLTNQTSPRAGGSPSVPARVTSATSHKQTRLGKHKASQG